MDIYTYCNFMEAEVPFTKQFRISPGISIQNRNGTQIFLTTLFRIKNCEPKKNQWNESDNRHMHIQLGFFPLTAGISPIYSNISVQ